VTAILCRNKDGRTDYRSLDVPHSTKVVDATSLRQLHTQSSCCGCCCCCEDGGTQAPQLASSAFVYQHWDRRLVEHVVADAAQERFADLAQSARTHQDQTDVFVACHLEDEFARRSAGSRQPPVLHLHNSFTNSLARIYTGLVKLNYCSELRQHVRGINVNDRPLEGLS